jgi:hypothetical protein
MQSCGMPSEMHAPEDGGDGSGRLSCDGLMGRAWRMESDLFDILVDSIGGIAFYISRSEDTRLKIYKCTVDDTTTSSK